MDNTRVVRKVFPREQWCTWTPSPPPAVTAPTGIAAVEAQTLNAAVMPARRKRMEEYFIYLPRRGIGHATIPTTPPVVTEQAANIRLEFLGSGRRRQDLLRPEWRTNDGWNVPLVAPPFDPKYFPRVQEAVVPPRRRSLLYDTFRRGIGLVPLPLAAGIVGQAAADVTLALLWSARRRLSQVHFAHMRVAGAPLPIDPAFNSHIMADRRLDLVRRRMDILRPEWLPQSGWNAPAAPTFNPVLFPRVHETRVDLSWVRPKLRPQHQDWLQRLDWAYGTVAPQIASMAGVFAHELQQQLLMRKPPRLDVYRQWVHEHPAWMSQQISLQHARYAGTYQTQREQAFLPAARRKLLLFREEWSPQPAYLTATLTAFDARLFPRTHGEMVRAKRRLAPWMLNAPERLDWLYAPSTANLPRQWAAMDELLRSDYLLHRRRTMTMFREEWSPEAGWITATFPVYDARLFPRWSDVLPPRRPRLALWTLNTPERLDWITRQALVSLPRQLAAIDELIRSEYRLRAPRKLSTLLYAWTDLGWLFTIVPLVPIQPPLEPPREFVLGTEALHTLVLAETATHTLELVTAPKTLVLATTTTHTLELATTTKTLVLTIEAVRMLELATTTTKALTIRMGEPPS